MAIEDQVLSEISRSVQRVSNTSESFRITANQQNSNIQKIIKDMSSMFKTQSRAQQEFSSSIDELKEQMSSTNEKTDAVSARLSDTIGIQNSMLGELRNIGRSMDSLTNLMQMTLMSGGGGFGGGGGRGGGSATATLGRLFGLGLLGGGIGAAAGAIAQNSPSSASNDDEISAMLAAIKQKETGGEADPYKAIARNQQTGEQLPLGAETGTGAYQFIPSTWKDAAARANIDISQYPQARDAPPEIQDKVARDRAEYLRKQAGGDISQVPPAWRGSNNAQTNADYRASVMANYNQRLSQQQNATPESTAETSSDFIRFLVERTQNGQNINAEKLNPAFAAKLKDAIEKAEKATGGRIQLTSGWRDHERQAQLFANWINADYTYKGNIYRPNGEPRVLAAEPETSDHEDGTAIDISENDGVGGAAREYIRKNAASLGLKDLGDRDPVHFADSGAATQTQTNTSNIPSTVAATSSAETIPQDNIMAGLSMPSGMGPGSEPTRIGMGDMDSYNPMGILASMAGGNMFGPSGQMGAIGAGLNVAGGLLSGLQPSRPDTRASDLNQAAVEQTAAPWQDPDRPQQPWQDPGTEPGYQPPPRNETNRRIDPDTYNHPDDRSPTSSFGEKLVVMMGLGLATWAGSQ